MDRDQFAALAAAQVGKPYVFGAETSPAQADPPAFDCSELVQWLFDRAGCDITDLAALQYSATIPVMPGSEMVGDLVFLANDRTQRNNIGHVAVITQRTLAGDDWVVIEARSRAAGVVATTLSYWRTRSTYAGTRRFPALQLTAKGTPDPMILRILNVTATPGAQPSAICAIWGDVILEFESPEELEATTRVLTADDGDTILAAERDICARVLARAHA